jgi:hypothetical protein
MEECGRCSRHGQLDTQTKGERRARNRARTFCFFFFFSWTTQKGGLRVASRVRSLQMAARIGVLDGDVAANLLAERHGVLAERRIVPDGEGGSGHQIQSLGQHAQVGIVGVMSRPCGSDRAIER